MLNQPATTPRNSDLENVKFTVFTIIQDATNDNPNNKLKTEKSSSVTTVRGVVGVNDATTTSRIWAIPVSF